MPVRVMEYEAMEYRSQLDEIARKHEERKNLQGNDEYLSRMKKKDTIAPVITLVIYYGREPWDGMLDLYGMMNLEEEDPLLSCVNNYKINLFDYHNYQRYQIIKTGSAG